MSESIDIKTLCNLLSNASPSHWDGILSAALNLNFSDDDGMADEFEVRGSGGDSRDVEVDIDCVYFDRMGEIADFILGIVFYETDKPLFNSVHVNVVGYLFTPPTTPQPDA